MPYRYERESDDPEGREASEREAAEDEARRRQREEQERIDAAEERQWEQERRERNEQAGYPGGVDPRPYSDDPNYEEPYDYGFGSPGSSHDWDSERAWYNAQAGRDQNYRPPGAERDPASAYDPDSAWMTDQGARPGRPLSPEEELVAGIPVVGGLSGIAGLSERQQDFIEAERNRQAWRDLAATAPTVDELTPDTFLEGTTDEYGNLIGGDSQFQGFGESGDQRAAMNALWTMHREGGWSDRDAQIAADERRLSAMERGQQLRGANEAALQQGYARGMGGGGAELGARLSGGQALAQGQAMGDALSNAQQQQAAQARALQALQGYQSGANTMQSQEMDRRAQIDQWNARNTDWRRGREERNTGNLNTGAQQRASAVQQAHDNREAVVAGTTGQYSTDLAARNAQRDRDRQREQDAAGFIAGLFE